MICLELLKMTLKFWNFTNVLIQPIFIFLRNINTESVSKLGRAGLTWTSYYTLEDIYAWLDELAAQNPTVSIISAGQSYEGRDLKGVKVSFKEGNRGVLIESGIHAREWIGPATSTYLLNEILTSTDPTFRKIAESFDWYIFPSNNPDGFTFTHTTVSLTILNVIY